MMRGTMRMMLNMMLSWSGRLLFFVAVVLAAASPTAASNIDNNVHAGVNVATFSLDDLLTGRRSDELSIVLRTTGLLAVVPEDYYSAAVGGDVLQDNDYFTATTATAALQGLCRCASDNAQGFLSMDGTDTMTLDSSGLTTRTTLATATVGTTPLPLPDSLASHCGLDTAAALDTLRDQVAVVSQAFIQAFDRLLLLGESVADLNQQQQQQQQPLLRLPLLLRNVDGGSYSTMAAIRDAANHLEHFHVYNKQAAAANGADYDEKDKNKNKNNNTYSNTLDWHTDAGLFLAFVPAINCNEQHDHHHQQADHSFWFMDATTQTPIQAIFPKRSIAIMLGAGAEHWLDIATTTTSSSSSSASSSSSRVPSQKLKATRHAVQMHSGDTRAWYGMMHLVPDRAIIQSSPIRRTFADMKRAMTLSAAAAGARTFGHDEEQLQQHAAPSIGCGFSTDSDDTHHHQIPDVGKASSSADRRRRLQHVESAGECNNVTNFFCWMQCLDVPNHEQARGFINEGYSLYCLDPATLASSGNRVSSAAAPCAYGNVHNAACQGSWQPTAPGVTAYPLNVEDDASETQELAFCYGGTSMYMDGFHWLNPTCVIYLFPTWVLSTPAKLAAATMGTLFSGMALEKIIQQRRLVVSYMDSGYKRLGVSSLFYAVQLTLGYMIMLVVMTYSGPLFLAVVVGLVGGHVLFNANDAFFPGVNKKAEAPSQRSTRENGDKMNDDSNGEESSNDDKAEDADKTTNGSKRENNSNTLVMDSCCKEETSSGTKTPGVHVPEGLTPCCLNTL